MSVYPVEPPPLLALVPEWKKICPLINTFFFGQRVLAVSFCRDCYTAENKRPYPPALPTARTNQISQQEDVNN